MFTLFPEMVEAGVTTGVIGRGISAGHLDVRTHDPRDTTSDVHRTVDDSPFGGGAGMVMKAEPILASIEQADPPRPVFYLGPCRPPLRPAVRRGARRHRRLLDVVRPLRRRGSACAGPRRR